MDRYIIRIGKQEDCAEILRLIKELANHEKKGEYVNITEESKYIQYNTREQKQIQCAYCTSMLRKCVHRAIVGLLHTLNTLTHIRTVLCIDLRYILSNHISV